jgi:adenylate cyclase
VAPEGVERRLAAILSADVVGYSRLMAEDEEATVRRLTAYRDQVGMLVSEHRGHVVDFTGDNFLAEFPTALEAAHCAVEIQRVLKGRNADLPSERKMEFRIGVHLGDIRIEGERLYGDGVNIAARLEGSAEPGGICISGEVHGQVHGKLDVEFEDLGEQSLKNIAEPVRVFRVQVGPGAVAAVELRPRRRVFLALAIVLLLGVGGWALWSLLRAPAATVSHAIAVLPFDDLSGDPEVESLAAGIGEDLIARLSQRPALSVRARTSTLVYKGKTVDVKQVGEELDARFVVEGSVRKEGDRVRVVAQLIDAVTGDHVWSETYDRELLEALALQDEISELIDASMYYEMLRHGWALARSGKSGRSKYRALIASGWWYWERDTSEDNARARSLFQQAIEIDPLNWRGFWGLAMAQEDAIRQGWTDSRELSIAELERAARSCIDLAPRNAYCEIARGFSYSYKGQRDKTIAAFERAVELNPSDTVAHVVLGIHLAQGGRPEEAIAVLAEARRLSPKSAPAEFFEAMSWAHFAAGRYQAAVEWAQQNLRHYPEDRYAYRTLAASYAQLGRLREAREALVEAIRLEPDVSIAKVRTEFTVDDPDFIERWLDGLRKAGLKE